MTRLIMGCNADVEHERRYNRRYSNGFRAVADTKRYLPRLTSGASRC